MSADGLDNVSALLIFSLKNRSEDVEAMGDGERRDQCVTKESIMMLVICCVPLILWSSGTGISQVRLSPGSRRLSFVGIRAMVSSRLSVCFCCVEVS